MLRVSRLADDLPEITDLDINPVIARPDGAFVVDARVKVAPYAPQDPYLIERVLVTDGFRVLTWASRPPGWHGMCSNCSAHTLTIAAAGSQRSGDRAPVRGLSPRGPAATPADSPVITRALHANRDMPKSAAAAGVGQGAGAGPGRCRRGPAGRSERHRRQHAARWYRYQSKQIRRCPSRAAWRRALASHRLGDARCPMKRRDPPRTQEQRVAQPGRTIGFTPDNYEPSLPAGLPPAATYPPSRLRP